MRSKQLELFAKMHLGMDHVLAKLLLDAPRLPDSMKLQTETQSLGTTWVQVTQTFEKRQAMLQRRKEKEKEKNTKREEKGRGSEEGLEKSKKQGGGDEVETVATAKQKKKSKNSRSSASPRSGKSSSARVEMEVKSSKKKQIKKKEKEKNEGGNEEEEKKKKKPVTTGVSPRVEDIKANVVKEVKVDDLSAHDQVILEKIRKLPMCQDVTFGSKKYKAIAKWIELDKGNNAVMPLEVAKVLDELQLDAAVDTTSKPKLSRKRSLETLDDVLRAEKRNNRQPAAKDRKWYEKQSKSHVDDEKVLHQSGEEEATVENHEDSPDSEEAEFVPDLSICNSSLTTSNEKEDDRVPKKQKQEEETTGQANEEDKSTLQMAPTTQPAAESAQTLADEAACVAKAKYLLYENMAKPITTGDSVESAIILDDSEEVEGEDEEDEEEESDEIEEEKTKEVQEHDSSTDDDPDLFDLNEEDVYVVEAILCVKEGRVLLSAGGVRRPKESDLYLVKWEDYDELTWEPEENIPQRLIEMFRERERAKRACQYQIKIAHERKEVTNVTTQAKDIIYMVQWVNQDVAVWESRTTLPSKTQVWLDKVLGGASAKKRS
uniref:Chromo domain-containing protein n=1 Tax=Hyaloperonospora arabidopsidis (strain Emoy2) TaxID=559515 RepID=M4BBF2_HYAAE